ncbi:MAG: hypothetical protein AAFY02_07875 [Pseudomonadota bacterium]
MIARPRASVVAGCLLLILVPAVLSGCGLYNNPCDQRATAEERAACRNQLIDFDRSLRGNRAYRTL